MAHQPTGKADLDHVIEVTRAEVAEHDPDLIDMFDLYAGEARFGRTLIDDRLQQVAPGGRLLEVGGGPLLLAAGLAAEGFAVTTIEPNDTGFGHMARLGRHTTEVARRLGVAMYVVDAVGEHYEHAGPPIDFAFSINVMEHVARPSAVIERTMASLWPGGVFQFVCPNYRFPYEPHFNSVTLGTRRLTERFLAPRWIARATFPDPVGTWASLNWITTTTIRRAVDEVGGIGLELSPAAVGLYFERAAGPGDILARKGSLFGRLTRGVRRSGLLRLVRFVPTAVLPVIDCRLTRLAPD